MQFHGINGDSNKSVSSEGNIRIEPTHNQLKTIDVKATEASGQLQCNQPKQRMKNPRNLFVCLFVNIAAALFAFIKL